MFYFKGTSSDSMNIVVSKTPKISKGQKRIDKVNIPGRNGFLHIDNGTYDSFVISVECHLNSNVADVDDVLAWLDGAGKLSFDNVRQWDAVITNSITLEKVISDFRSFLIQFEVQPIAEVIAETTYTVASSPATLAITDATAKMEPITEITGSGDVSITINGKTFHLYDMAGKYILDSKLKVITDSTGANVSDKMLYDFPVLSPGNNAISFTGTITEFKIKYHKSYL